MSKEEDELDQILDVFDKELRDATNPPPGFEELVDAAARSESGVEAAIVSAAKRELVGRIIEGQSFGALLRARRLAAARHVDELAAQAGWRVEQLESLEINKADLGAIPPESLAALLYELGFSRVGPLEDSLRKLALRHLAVFGSGPGPVFGRTRRGVTPTDRRDGLTAGMPVDSVATARLVDQFVRRIEEGLIELART